MTVFFFISLTVFLIFIHVLSLPLECHNIFGRYWNKVLRWLSIVYSKAKTPWHTLINTLVLDIRLLSIPSLSWQPTGGLTFYPLTVVKLPTGGLQLTPGGVAFLSSFLTVGFHPFFPTLLTLRKFAKGYRAQGGWKRSTETFLLDCCFYQMASPSLGGADSLTVGHSCVLFLSRAQVGFTIQPPSFPPASTSLALPKVLHIHVLFWGPMPFLGCPLGQDLKCFQFSWMPMCPRENIHVHFSLTHSGRAADPNVATILFASLAEQLDDSSLPFRFSRWVSDFGTLHSPNSCINTARPEVSLKTFLADKWWEALHLPLWKTGGRWEQPQSPLQMSPPWESPTARSLW